MSDDDFDKIEDEDFAEEFDFVDDENHPAAAKKAGGNVAPTQQPAKKFGPIIAVAAVVVIGGYFAYQAFSGGDKKPAAKVADNKQLPPPGQQIAQQNPADQHLPSTPPAQIPGAPAPTHPAAPTEAPVDFNQHPPAAGPMPSTGQPTIEGALPQGKSFSQIQKDLTAAPVNQAAAKPAIPVEINATLDAISEEMTLNVNQIKHLENTITNLASTVEQLNKSISAMDNRVLGLTETVDGLAQDLNNVKKVMADEDMDLTSSNKLTRSTTPNKTTPISAKSAEYTVHAIIPGRAWLKSSDGQIITVTEGDKIGDYGTVAVIDAANGLVRTSSGITFR